MERSARVAALGLHRLRILDCLGGNDERAPGYFDPDPNASIFDAFRDYAIRMAEAWGGESDASVVSLIAAARVLTGDVAAARIIVDQLPVRPYELDHGAGICMVAPLHALAGVLPLPPVLNETRRWIAGSAEQMALRDWLDEHAGALRWSETEGAYELGTP